MAVPSLPTQEVILAVDIGATNIKFCHVDAHGEFLEGIRRRPTPYPCTPARLMELLVERIAQSDCPRVGIGFPGEFVDGRVVRPGNLSRPGGVTTAVDPVLEQEWCGFELQAAMRDATGRDVRVVNDATLAALGCCEGVGREVVLTLGTGLGIALCVEGEVRKIRDVGAAPYRDQTYDQLLGESSRAHDEQRWGEMLVDVVEGFAKEFSATTVHLAGGNARRVVPTLFSAAPVRVVINGNGAPLKGAAKLFYG